MKLKQSAIDRVKDKTVRARLAFELGVIDVTVIRWIKANDDNGPLTTVKALEIIEQETGLTQNELLDKGAAAVRA